MSLAIGDKLKKARLQQTLSLEEIQSRIKIHPRILELMEEGRFEKLPSPLFAKNFLKSYATCLGLNASDLIEEFQKDASVKPAQADAQIFIRSADERDKKTIANQFSLEGVIPVVIFILIVVALFFISRPVVGWLKDYSAQHLQAKKNPTLAVATKKTSKTQTKKVSNQTPSAAVVAVPSKNGWLRSVDQQNFPNLATGVPLQLSIKASDNVWLRVTCDGKVLFQAVLKRGAVENWNALDKIEVWSGNPANMSMALNGYKLGSPGKGSVKKMLISHQGVKTVS